MLILNDQSMKNMNILRGGGILTIFKKVTEGAKSLGEGARTIGKKSSDLVETTKLKMEISKREKEMENNLSALGNLVFMQYKGEEGLEDEVDRLLQSTRELETEIAELHEQVARLNPKPPTCPSCKTQLPLVAKFCYICGTKITSDNPEG
ncbi:MAG TPA: zinc ribbon domain-containing protein [Bacillota bacterium]|nr:zinc ribbon domain-containing protein [Bacillota bacterium]HUM59780.1 zinc ribbon domain-containing protein [Bacillota bacterium]